MGVMTAGRRGADRRAHGRNHRDRERAAGLDAARHELARTWPSGWRRSASSCGRRRVVGDNRREVAEHLRRALDRADLVILTGGLGPTDDDVTRDALADVLGLPLIEHPDDRRAPRAALRAAGLHDAGRQSPPGAGHPGRRGPRESEWHRAGADGRRRPSARRPPARTAARAAADDGRARRGPARGAGRPRSACFARRSSPSAGESRTSRSWCSRSTRSGCGRRRRSRRRSSPRRVRSSCTSSLRSADAAAAGRALARGPRRDPGGARAGRLQHRRALDGGDRRSAPARPEAHDRGGRVVHRRPDAVAADRHTRQLGVRRSAAWSSYSNALKVSLAGVPAALDRRARRRERAGCGRARRRYSRPDRRVDRRRHHRHRRSVRRNAAEAGRHGGRCGRQRRRRDSGPHVLCSTVRAR